MSLHDEARRTREADCTEGFAAISQEVARRGRMEEVARKLLLSLREVTQSLHPTRDVAQTPDGGKARLEYCCKLITLVEELLVETYAPEHTVHTGFTARIAEQGFRRRLAHAALLFRAALCNPNLAATHAVARCGSNHGSATPADTPAASANEPSGA